MNAMEISRTGMDVEWKRLEIIAQNIANMGTTLDPAGHPYRPLKLLSGPKMSFQEALHGNGDGAALRGAAVYSVEPQNVQPRRVYEPSHPQADAQGFVSYPGTDHVAEMTLMMKATRTYEANIVAYNSARQMYSKALEIGRR